MMSSRRAAKQHRIGCWHNKQLRKPSCCRPVPKQRQALNGFLYSTIKKKKPQTRRANAPHRTAEDRFPDGTGRLSLPHCSIRQLPSPPTVLAPDCTAYPATVMDRPLNFTSAAMVPGSRPTSQPPIVSSSAAAVAACSKKKKHVYETTRPLGLTTCGPLLGPISPPILPLCNAMRPSGPTRFQRWPFPQQYTAEWGSAPPPLRPRAAVDISRRHFPAAAADRDDHAPQMPQAFLVRGPGAAIFAALLSHTAGRPPL